MLQNSCLKMKTIYSGIWWLPEDDNKNIFGNLIIEDDEIILETIICEKLQFISELKNPICHTVI